MTHNGVLHMYVAFDWGDEIELDKAAELAPASVCDLPRRRRTPSSFSYRPPPLFMPMEPIALNLEGLGGVEAPAGLTLFPFGAVSLSLRIPFQLAEAPLLRLAGSLAEATALLDAVRTALLPWYHKLQPAIQEPSWQPQFSEEYFVFQLPPGSVQMAVQRAWLAGLVHLDDGALSGDEIEEAVRLHLCYSPKDLFVPDWAAAVLMDEDCDETLQAIEFANLQLLEFRHIDDRLDASLAEAQQIIAPLTRSVFPFWRLHGRPLRRMGELKAEAASLFERAGNVLKLVGDPYLARVYRLLSQRFHLDAWEKSIGRKLETTEGVYKVVSDQASHYRTEFLELIVVLLILVEIIMAFLH